MPASIQQGHVTITSPPYISNCAKATLVVIAVAAAAALTFALLAQLKISPIDQMPYKWTAALWATTGALALAEGSFLIIRKCLHIGELKKHQVSLKHYEN
jgi:uncharacterized membrane protein YczE